MGLQKHMDVFIGQAFFGQPIFWSAMFWSSQICWSTNCSSSTNKSAGTKTSKMRSIFEVLVPADLLVDELQFVDQQIWLDQKMADQQIG